MLKKRFVDLITATMRISLTQVLLAVVFTGSSFAKEADAQELTDKKITISAQKKELSAVLTEIEKQTGIKIVYSPSSINASRKISLNASGRKLGEVLDNLLKPLHISYKVVNNNSLLLYDGEEDASPDAGTTALQVTVSGTVTAESGDPLSGVSVAIKDAATGTTTNASGKYTITVPGNETVLVFSYVGYTSQELTVNSRTAIDVQLVAETKALNEVVVVGYGTRKISDLTGAVANVKAANTNLGGASTSVDQMLAGRVSGVQFKENSAQPGGGGKTIIRGRNSLFLNSDPLYIIDGFIINSPVAPGSDASFSAPDRNPLNSINPNDIESVSVLKDAAATAIYGAKGSNGVIIITTKRGKRGKAKVSYDTYYSLQTVAKRFDMMNAQQYMNFWNGLGVTNFTTTQIANAQTNDWFKEVTHNGQIQSHNLNISGASDNLNYFFSLGYFDHDGIVKNSGMQRLTGRGNLQYKKDKFSFTSNIFATKLTDKNRPTQGGTRSSVIASAIAFAPYVPVYDSATGAYSRDPRNDFIANPVSLLDIKDQLNTDKMNFSVSADYEIAKGLRPEVRVTYDVQNVGREFYVPTTTAYNGNFSHGGTATQTNQRSVGYTVNGLLHYDATFSGGHKLTGLLGYEYYFRGVNLFSASNSGFGTNGTGANNLGGGSSPIVSSNKYNRKDISVFGRVDYSFGEKYLATATLRRDGSSVFGANNKFAWFPGISLGWRLDKEDFMANRHNVDLLKLRVGYGQTGNSGITSYQSLSKYDLVTTGIIGQTPVVGATLTSYRENPDLKWETTAQYNVGLDYGFFKRVTGALDFFVKNTKNMLVQVNQTPLSGYEYQWQNAATMRGWGIEYSINTANIRSKDFEWNTVLNFSWLNNRITGYNTTDSSTIAALNTIGVIKGERTNSYYTYIADGVDPASGSFKFRDIYKDGVIDSKDRAVAGSPDPKFIVGLGNTLRYKQFTLDFFFNSNFGNKLHNQTRAQYSIPSTQDVSNYLVDAQDYYSTAHPNSDLPNNRGNNGGSWLYNSHWIENAWFIRLQNLSLSYNLAGGLFKGAINNVRLYVQAQNLFLITRYKGLDPEAANNSYINATENMPAFLPGSTDINAYPPARTFTAGVSLNF